MRTRRTYSWLPLLLALAPLTGCSLLLPAMTSIDKSVDKSELKRDTGANLHLEDLEGVRSGTPLQVVRLNGSELKGVFLRGIPGEEDSRGALLMRVQRREVNVPLEEVARYQMGRKKVGVGTAFAVGLAIDAAIVLLVAYALTSMTISTGNTSFP